MSDPATSDIQRIRVDGKEIILVGTAHISQESVDTVERIITEERPDTVCVELDGQRLQALRDKHRWEALNLIQVIKTGQAPFLLANLALAAYQKRMGLQTGVKPGAELSAAARTAENLGMRVELVDREIRTTLLRAWRKTGFWKRMQLLSTLIAGMFETQKLDEAELARLRQSDTLSAMLDEMSGILPSIKTILVDERDHYMAYHIRQAPGEKVVAVVGAAHLPGILRRLPEENLAEGLHELSQIPRKPRFSKAVSWLIPGLILLLFIGGFFFGDRQMLTEAALGYLLATGLFSALGTSLALGHPLTIAAAFFAAPLTILHPAIGIGMVTGPVQAYFAAPTVRDMERVSDDLACWRGWWSNRMTRVLLVFLFSSLGAMSGALSGALLAFNWLKNLI